MNQKIDWKKYILVFFITLSLFLTAVYLSNFFHRSRAEEIKSIQSKIAIDILSSETQYALLEDLSCKDVSNSMLSQELNSLGDKIDYQESNSSAGNAADLVDLKRYYSLLEIKDYLLMQKVTERCGEKAFFILYFYTDKENCSECVKQGYVLTALREKYPSLRVYSFDYSLDLSAVRALKSIYKIDDRNLPALIINKEVVTGFKSVEDIEEQFPELETLLIVEKTKEELGKK
ncbi:MAG: hypothetical protein MUD00_02860 [Candidatus Pacebacteria bacterium]|jgi:uncharacterized protein YdcH (DUF465 family)|nr:hypothetical protein [Candidatus Paceibacterota bacterium]